MKNLYTFMLFILFSISVFSQEEQWPASRLIVYNYTDCPKYFAVAGIKDCKGCYQYQEDFLTDTTNLFMVSGVNEDGTPGTWGDEAVNLFGGGYISHVKLAHGGPPQCGLGKITGTHCLGMPLEFRYQDNLCSTFCVNILSTWKPAEVCGGTAFLTFTEYNPNSNP